MNLSHHAAAFGIRTDIDTIKHRSRENGQTMIVPSHPVRPHPTPFYPVPPHPSKYPEFPVFVMPLSRDFILKTMEKDRKRRLGIHCDAACAQ